MLPSSRLQHLYRLLVVCRIIRACQQRKPLGKREPYILHPLRVMCAVDAPHRIVAVLHDVVEDGDLGLGDILAIFGEEVREAVNALTRRERESYGEFIVRCKANPIARQVKIADIRDNLRPGAPHLRERYEAAMAVLTEDAG